MINVEDETFPGIPAARRAADIARLRALTADSAQQTAVPPRRGYRRWGARGGVVAGGVSVLLVGAGIAGAAAHLTARHATNTTSGRCYWEVSTNFGSDFPGGTMAEATNRAGWTPSLISNLVADCAATWRDGSFQIGKPGNHFGTHGTAVTYPVPPLTPCVLPDGTAAVFPAGPSVCDQLNLHPLAR